MAVAEEDVASAGVLGADTDAASLGFAPGVRCDHGDGARAAIGIRTGISERDHVRRVLDGGVPGFAETEAISAREIDAGDIVTIVIVSGPGPLLFRAMIGRAAHGVSALEQFEGWTAGCSQRACEINREEAKQILGTVGTHSKIGRKRAVIRGIHGQGETELAKVILTRSVASLGLCCGQGWKQKGRQDGDDSNDDEKFDEGEGGTGATNTELRACLQNAIRPVFGLLVADTSLLVSLDSQSRHEFVSQNRTFTLRNVVRFQRICSIGFPSLNNRMNEPLRGWPASNLFPQN